MPTIPNITKEYNSDVFPIELLVPVSSVDTEGAEIYLLFRAWEDDILVSKTPLGTKTYIVSYTFVGYKETKHDYSEYNKRV